MGDTDYTQIPDIITALGKLKIKSFELNFSEINGFPNKEEAQTLWIGIYRGAELIGLHSTVLNSLREVKDNPEEKKFIPHVTIARFKTPFPVARLHLQNIDFGHFSAKKMFLFESELASDGPKHTPLKVFHF